MCISWTVVQRSSFFWSVAIDTVARAKGMTKTAKEAGISREGLYKALSPNGNPSFATVCKILNAIGYILVPERIAKKTEA